MTGADHRPITPLPAVEAGRDGPRTSPADHFDAAYYLEANADVRAFGIDALDHYIRFGQAEGRPRNAIEARRRVRTLDDPGGVQPAWFEPEWYRGANRDVDRFGFDPFRHYLDHGHKEGRPPNRAVSRIDKLVLRPLLRGAAEDVAEDVAAIEGSALFDRAWYAARYGVAPEEAVRHYVVTGTFLGHDPNPFFSSFGYFEANPDIAMSGHNPLAHYVTHGFAEGRRGGATLPETRVTSRIWRRGL